MKTDTLNRRIRFAAPAPLVRRLNLTEPDFLLFEAIDRHGPLPTNYLYEFQRHIRKDYTHLQNRLTEFYNGDAGGPYLKRPSRQFDAFNARYQHMVYDLSERGRAALGARAVQHPLRRTNSFVHDLMSACVSASIELTAKAMGLVYVSRNEILTGDLVLPLRIDRDTLLIPDDLFGIGYPDGWVRYCALEADRGTEPITSANGKRNHFAKKIDNYLRVLKGGLFKEGWGTENLGILTVTTYPNRPANIMAHLKGLNETRFEGRFAFRCEPSFGTETYANTADYEDAHWRVPKTVLTELLEEPWATIGGPKDMSHS